MQYKLGITKTYFDTAILGPLERNELLKTVKHLGRALWKKGPSYHRRRFI